MPTTSLSQNTEDNQDLFEQLKIELQGVIETVWSSEDYYPMWDKLMEGQPTGSLLKQLTKEIWQKKDEELSSQFASSLNLSPNYDSDDSFY